MGTKVLIGLFEHPDFLGSNTFSLFSFEGKKGENNRSDVISFSRILIKKKQGQVALWHSNALDLI